MTEDQPAVSTPTIQSDADLQPGIVRPIASPSIDSGEPTTAQLRHSSAQKETVSPQIETENTDMDLDALATDAADGKAKGGTSISNDDEPSRLESMVPHGNHDEQVTAPSERSQTKETQMTQAEETLSQVEEDLQTRNALRNIVSSQNR